MANSARDLLPMGPPPCEDCPRKRASKAALDIAARLTRMRKSGLRGSITIHVSPDALDFKIDTLVTDKVRDLKDE
jgi:hypothetical protein